MDLDRPDGRGALEFCIVVPTFNELQNVEPLIARLSRVMGDRAYEVVFVDDDSPDGTAEAVKTIARTSRHVRCIRRVGRRGLSSAVIEGALSTCADFIAVIDGDMQHDEKLLPRMFDVLKAGEAEVIVGSRYVEGGGTGNWSSSRESMSRFATRVAQFVIRAGLTDPMSGFFAIRRDVLDEIAPRLGGSGFKILLDIFASSEAPLRFQELPYEFNARIHGESKLDSFVLWEFAMLLLDKTVGHIVPARFVMFGAVGFLGLFVHMSVLWFVLKVLATSFLVAQATATMTAMTSNYILNNFLTYRDMRLKGVDFLLGLLSFYAVCAVGAVANVGVANFIFEDQRSAWWVAGLAGTLVGVVWNYAASSVLTWNGRPKRRRKGSRRAPRAAASPVASPRKTAAG